MGSSKLLIQGDIMKKFLSVAGVIALSVSMNANAGLPKHVQKTHQSMTEVMQLDEATSAQLKTMLAERQQKNRALRNIEDEAEKSAARIEVRQEFNADLRNIASREQIAAWNNRNK